MNPAGKGYLAVAIANNKIIGTASITKKKLLINEKLYLAGEIGDTYTLPNMRREKPECLSEYSEDPKSYINRSIFGRMVTDLVKQAEKDGITIIYGTPNKNSYPGYIKRLGFKELPYSNFSYSRPKIKQFIRYYPVLKYFRKIASMIDYFYVNLVKMMYKKIYYKDIKFDSSDIAPQGIQQLFEQLILDKGFSLLRDFKYWEYRYGKHPLYKYTFHSCLKNNILVGVVVSRVMDLPDGRKAVAIPEWMISKDLSLSYLLINIIYYYRKLDLDVFILWGIDSNLYISDIKKNLFIKRNKIPIIIHNKSAVNIEDLGEKFQFYMGSSDAV